MEAKMQRGIQGIQRISFQPSDFKQIGDWPTSFFLYLLVGNVFFHGLELRYQKLEKIAFVLIVSA